MNVLLLFFLPSVHAAGWCKGIENGEGCGPAHEKPSAQQLNLEAGEQPRDAVWGAGLIETVIKVDVFVAGGGSAGTSAALAAARSGATTVLVNGRPVLGGNSGSEIRLAMVGACGPRAGSGNANALRMECREGGIVEEYQLDNAVNNPNMVPDLFSLEILTLCKAEPNLQVFQNTWFVGTEMRNGSSAPTIVAAIAENQQSQRRYIIKAKTYIDATGDGRLGAEAGAEWIQGREGYNKYNESLAKLGFYRTSDFTADHETEGTSLDFEAKQWTSPTTFRAPFWAAKYNASQFAHRGVDATRPYGYWWNEISWPYNTITDGENVTQEALADLLGIWDYLKNGNDTKTRVPEMGLTWFGNVPCKREGRRFVGQYVVSQNDILKDSTLTDVNSLEYKVQEPALFYDRVAYSGWPFDLHNPKGMRDPSHPPFTSHRTPYMFSTPLRSLIAKDVSNLFFAGRLASFSHVVYGSERVMKTCATMGQAAGTAAAYAVKHQMDPIALASDTDAVWSIQQQLLRDDAYIIGMYNEDPRDVARTATSVTATSSMPTNGTIDGGPANVLSGQTRASNGPGGVPASQGKPGTNRWISASLPASIELTLAKPVAVKEVQLVFDSGMHRKLTWSAVYKTNNPASRWGPQPETVRDYMIEGKDASTGKWVVLCNVTGNYQRRRVHMLPCGSGPSPPGPPSPGPPPKPPVVAPGAVSSTFCNTTSSNQNWTVTTEGVVQVWPDGPSATPLCLGVDATIAGFGGHGNAVVARPCGATPTTWTWKAAAGGSFLALPQAIPCVEDKSLGCKCVHSIVCTACHTPNSYTPPTSVEIYTCNKADTHILWSSINVDTGSARSASTTATGMLMTDGGLCLEAPETKVVAGSKPTTMMPKLSATQRVTLAMTNEERAAALAVPTPVVSALRVTVTATNGVATARINEIRAYAADGAAPFPSRSSYHTL